MSVNDSFFKPLLVTLKSVRDNTNSSISLYFSGDISESNRAYLANVVDNVFFLDETIKEEIRNLNIINYNEYVSIESLTRVLAPFFVNCNRLLYLDADIVVNCDVQKLFDIDLGGMCVGVRLQSDFTPTIIDKVITNYFNAGVMLFDVNKIRDYIDYSKLVDFINCNGKSFRWYDESVMNYIYNESKYDIGEKYNVFALNRIFDWNKEKVLKEAKIIHFWGKVKPWNKKYFSFSAQKYYLKYAKHIFGKVYFFKLRIINHIIHPFYILKRIFFNVGAE